MVVFEVGSFSWKGELCAAVFLCIEGPGIGAAAFVVQRSWRSGVWKLGAWAGRGSYWHGGVELELEQHFVA